MALEQITFNIGAFDDADAGGNNYFAGEIYEVFNTNDTLADIFSDAAGANPINQDGISNKSNASGEVVFYIAAGSYYILSGGKRRDFKVSTDSIDRYNPLTVEDAINSTEWNTDAGEILNIQEYYSGTGGGGQWETITAGLSDGVNLPNGRNIVQCVGVPSLAIKLKTYGGVFNVKQCGARGDGVTDDNLAINDIMLIANKAGGSVYFPASTYVCGQFDARSNIDIYGDGYASILKDNPGKVDPGENKVLMRMFGTSSDPIDNIRNVTIRSLHFIGNVLGEGFKEFKHLIMIQGGTNIEIHSCIFNGFQGDALVIRSGNNEYKNRNIKVHHNVFDGANGDNRNAISITDADGLWITDNDFRNCTRFNQPGAIDIEPNPTYGFVILNHIVIRGNNFVNIGGNVACIGMYLPLPTEDFTIKPANITVENNTMTNVFRGLNFTQLQVANVADSYPNINIKCINNSVKGASDRGFWLYGMKGVTLRDNYFEDCANSSRIGWIDPFRRCNDIELINNTFRHCGTTDGNTVSVYESDRISFTDNTIDNCGVSGGGFGVPFVFTKGASSYIKFVRNSLINNEGLITGAFDISGGGSITAGGNILLNNDFLSLDTSSFPADFSDYGETSFTNSIAAATGGQSTATQIDSAINIVTTSSAPFDSVKLPPSTGGAREVTVLNESINTIQIYPSAGDDLGAGLNAPESLVSGSAKSYKSVSSSLWVKSTS